MLNSAGEIGVEELETDVIGVVFVELQSWVENLRMDCRDLDHAPDWALVMERQKFETASRLESGLAVVTKNLYGVGRCQDLMLPAADMASDRAQAMEPSDSASAYVQPTREVCDSQRSLLMFGEPIVSIQ